jgi:hypothetical protein
VINPVLRMSELSYIHAEKCEQYEIFVSIRPEDTRTNRRVGNEYHAYARKFYKDGKLFKKIVFICKQFFSSIPSRVCK